MFRVNQFLVASIWRQVCQESIQQVIRTLRMRQVTWTTLLPQFPRFHAASWVHHIVSVTICPLLISCPHSSQSPVLCASSQDPSCRSSAEVKQTPIKVFKIVFYFIHSVWNGKSHAVRYAIKSELCKLYVMEDTLTRGHSGYRTFHLGHRTYGIQGI